MSLILGKLKLDNKVVKQLDYTVVFLVLAITIFGITNIFSATQSNSLTATNWYLVRQQIFWLIIASALVFVILKIDYTLLLNYAFVIYWFSIILLFITIFFGKVVNGSRNWLYIGSYGIQPSEFAKLALILVLARKIEDFEGKINKLRNFSELFIYAIIPVVFLVKQPDMGMTMVFFFIVFGVVFAAKLNARVIIGGIVALIVLISAVWNSGLIQDYQKQRFTSFLNPDTNQTTTNYQFLQAQMAIGSGGVLGRGFLQGTQVRSGSIPEVQTDFIFAVVGEEWGFVGAISLLLAYYILIQRFLKIGRESKDIAGTIISVGVLSYYVFSIFQNIGMTIGLMPITGITLPLMSYGGSSLLSNYMGIALVLNVGMRRKKINF